MKKTNQKGPESIVRRLLLSALLLGMALGCSDTVQDPDGFEDNESVKTDPDSLPSVSGVRVEIFDDPVVDGVLRLRVDLDEYFMFATIELSVDGQHLETFTGARGTFQIDTLSMTDGEHELTARVTGTDGRVEWAAQAFRVQNPSMQVRGFEATDFMYPGAEVEIVLEVNGRVHNLAADFSSAVPGFSASDVEIELGERVRLLYRLPGLLVHREGWHLIPIRLTGQDGSTIWFRAVRMFLARGPKLPFRSGTASRVLGDLPEGGPEATARLTRLRTDRSIVSGGNLELVVGIEGELEGATLLVGAEGFGDHLEIPLAGLQPVEDKGTQTMRAVLSVLDGPGLSIKAAVRDANGEVSEPINGPRIHQEQAQAGPLRVHLSWEATQDLDLHVIEPYGDEIYWGSPQSAQTGVLDVDGMGDCTYDLETSDEMVVWERPPEGEYVVKVDFHRNCEAPGAAIEKPIPFRITVQENGVDTVTQGEVPAGIKPDSGSADAGFEVHRFVWKASFAVEGKATYRHLDFQNMPHVEKTSLLAGAEVQVVDETGAVLSEKDQYVREDGTYHLAFNPPRQGVDTPVYLRFKSQDPQAEVLGDRGEIHAYRDPDGWLPASEPSKHKDAEIPIDSAPAFHIFEVLKLGHRKIDKITEPWRQEGVPELAKTRVQWIPGQGKCTYFSNVGYVAGVPDTLDYFNDPVILRMQAAWILERLTRKHDVDFWLYHQQLDPEHAWNMGLTTFLAMHLIDIRKFCEHTKTVSKCIDFDDRRGFELGADLGPRGNISAELVAGILLDLEDTQDEGHDRLQGHADDFLEFVFVSMQDADDLADLIVHWACAALDRDDLVRLLTETYGLDWLESDNQRCLKYSDQDYYSDRGVELSATIHTETIIPLTEFEDRDTKGIEHLATYWVLMQLPFIRSSLGKKGYYLNNSEIGDRVTLGEDFEMFPEGDVVRVAFTLDFSCVITTNTPEAEDFIVGKDHFRTVSGLVPANPHDLLDRYGDRCASDTNGPELTNGNYFKYFLVGDDCPAETVEYLVEMDEVIPTYRTYPEYHRLVADDKVTVAVFFGGGLSDLEQNLGYENQHDFTNRIKLRGFRMTTHLTPFGERYQRKRSGLEEVIDVYGPEQMIDLLEGRDESFLVALSEHEIFMWNGHSGYGRADIFNDCEQSRQNEYQVFFLDSCWSYGYYADQVLRCKANENGYANIDVVNTLDGIYMFDMVDYAQILLFSLLAGCENTMKQSCDGHGPSCRHGFDWGDILGAMNRQGQKFFEEKNETERAIFGVSGVRDNCFEPGSWEQCPGVVHAYSTGEVMIPDGDADGVQSEIHLSADRSIHEAAVEFEIEHEQIGQLIVELEHDGTAEVLRWLEPEEGRLVKRLALHAFSHTCNAQGTWTLRVSDLETGHTGRLIRWSLHLY